MTRLDTFLGSIPVATTAGWLTRHRLRVLAYHDVSDPVAFAAQLDYLRGRFHIVSGTQVADSLSLGRELPERSLWLTFDDGRRSVVEHGLPALTSRGLIGTAFVCPGLVETGEPYWWSGVEHACSLGPVSFAGREWTDRRLVTHLKTVDDSVRRDFVTSLPSPGGLPDQSMDRRELDRWVDAGMEVGNHTWDHPVLPCCEPAEQRSQIVRAQDWLTQYLGGPCRTFAYPNGDDDESTRRVVSELRDVVAVRFDHHVCSRTPDPAALSRLRLDADAPPARVRAIASGAHSGAFDARRRLARNR